MEKISFPKENEKNFVNKCIFVLPFILLIVCFVSKKKDKLHLKKYNLEKYSFLVSKRQFEEASAKVQGSVARTLVKKDNKKRKAKVEK